METENFKEAGEIFQNVIEIEDPTKQEQYIENACKNNPRLRLEVETLLRAHEQAGDYLEAPAAGSHATLNGLAQIEGPGTKIGRYELLKQIGEGGMGLVYLAQQKKPVKRQVALKIVKPGMDSKQVIARFEAERQTLAVLDHPNIAHVLDAGTTKDGRPFFIMEYVKGMSITRYCDENRLNIEQRLRLFEQVCEGVHHAHQKGIIHRDLKPSNILVSVHGDRDVPKIIDFGIAKALAQPLTEKTLVTFQGQLLGTPEYMSPEQVDMATQDIDTRSDIYSLGVVLYELLAGVLPFERESLAGLGFAEIQRTIREQEPASPSTRLTSLGEKAKTIAESRGTQVIALARRLHRELEWIPLKAMRKDRCRRYKSASEMTNDVRNYLNGNPLIAGPETAVYRVNKFVHKHAGSVATAALVSVAVILGLVVSVILGCRAEQARQQEAAARIQVEQALTRTEKAEKMARQQRELAEEQRALAEERAEEYRRSLYIHRINLADVAHRDGDIARMRKLLDSCPEDLRAWEWYRLDYISDQAMKTLLGDIDGVYDVAFSPDGKRFVSAGAEGTIKIWNAADGKKLMTLHGHEAIVLSVIFSPDGKHIISGSYDGTVRIWEPGIDHSAPVTLGKEYRNMAFSPDGKQIVTSGGRWNKALTVWDAVTLDELMEIENAGGVASFSPNGKRIISADGNDIHVWDATNGKKLMTLSGHESGSFSKEQDGTFSGWQVDIWSMSYSPDGTRIVSGGLDKTVRVWNAITGAEMMTLRGHEDWSYWPELSPVSSVTFSPDGELIVSGSYDSTIRLWNARKGAELMTIRDHSSPVGNVTFSPNGKRIASAGSDGMVRVHDVSTGDQLQVLKGHETEVLSVAFSPDGKRIVSGSKDNTVRIWDAATGIEVQRLSIHGWVFNLCFSPDGKTLSGTINKGHWASDCTITLWESAKLGAGNEPLQIAISAREIVDELHEKYGSYHEVLSKLKDDTTISEPIRRAALQIANTRLWEDEG